MPEFTTDDDGRVRIISHRGEEVAARAGVGDQTPRQVADAYLAQFGDAFGLESEQLAGLDAGLAPRADPDRGVQLQFGAEKTTVDLTVVSYQQTYLGLPVWQSGVDVRIYGDPPAVASSTSTLQYGVDAQPRAAAGLAAPDDRALLVSALGLDPAQQDQVRVNSATYLVYRYVPGDRTDVADSDGRREGAGPATLDLPAVPGDIQPGEFYVVREILFTLPLPGWGSLNWRALVEPTAAAVLYLRAFVASVTGCVFLHDPVTLTGVVHDGCTPAATLDPLRTTVTLPGLDAPVAGVQNLRGHFVAMTDTDLPTIAPPTTTAPFSFCYTSTSDDFAATSAYFHYDGAYRLLEGMGINIASYFDGTAFPVPVDHQGVGAVVNAFAIGNAAGNGMGKFINGLATTGCPVGIATDWRLILHEFGHALLWDHVNSPNFGWCHSAGDTLGVILSDAESIAPDRFVTFPFVSVIDRRHDRAVGAGWAWGGTQDDRQYGSEQILSTTMFRVYRVTGGDAADVAEKRFAARYLAFLIVTAIGTLTTTTTNPAIYVNALFDADNSTVSFEGHPGGAWHKVVRWSFERQGLFQPPGAPTPVVQPGAPPDVDVYVDDGRAGGYEPFLADFSSTEVWNRRAADGGTTHEAAVLAAPNHVYVRVRNRGTQSANGVAVKLFRADPAGALNWPTDWTQAGGAVAAPAAIPPGGSVIVGPLTWTPQIVGQEALLASVSAPGDLSNADTVNGALPHRRLVPNDNNLAYRNIATLPPGTGNVHVAAVNSAGRLWHTIRFVNGSWQSFGDVEGQTGDMGTLRQSACASVAGAVHVAAVNTNGRLFHSIRFVNGSWQPFGDVEGQTGDMGTLSQVALAAVGPAVHLAAVNSVGRLFHSIRFANGSWQTFGDVEGQTGDMGALRQVALAAVGPEVHLAAVNSVGRLFHSIRFADGSWQTFGDVEGQTGDMGALSQVALAAVGPAVHLAAVNSVGRLFHSIRFANGSWQTFGDVEGQTGDMGSLRQVALAAVDPAVHLTAVNSVGRLFHTIRFANGSWQTFGDVEGQTGDMGSLGQASCAAI